MEIVVKIIKRAHPLMTTSNTQYTESFYTGILLKFLQEFNFPDC